MYMHAVIVDLFARWCAYHSNLVLFVFPNFSFLMLYQHIISCVVSALVLVVSNFQ